MPWELPDVLGPELAREGLKRLDPINHIAGTLIPDPLQPFARVATLESSLYMRNQLLRDTDWASMAHSLEVRVPLVDAVLLEKLAGIGTRHRSAERQVSVGGSAQSTGAAQYNPTSEDRIWCAHCQMDRPATAICSSRSGSAFRCCDRRDVTGRDVGPILSLVGLEPCGFSLSYQKRSAGLAELPCTTSIF